MEVLPDGTPLEDRLLSGELDALITLRTPRVFAARDARIARLFADPTLAERRSFERFGVFPIMHAVAVRKTLVAQHPELPRQLVEAFTAAKRMATDALDL